MNPHRLRGSQSPPAPQDSDLAAFDFKYDERPFPPITWFTEGEADVLVHEAIMTPHWQRLGESKRPVKYLPWGDAVLDAFAAEG